MPTQQVISFHYTLTDPDGKKLDSSIGQDPLSFFVGKNQIIPGLESQMLSLKKGEKKKLAVVAAQAYGERDERFVIKVPKANMPPEVAVGNQFETPEIPGHAFLVTEINDDNVTLDANHPLAGVNLTFDVEVMDVRDATDEEIAHGHAHGPGGHH